MDKPQMEYGTTYNVKIFREGEYIGSAVVRRVGAHHVETNTTMLHPRFLEQIRGAIDATAAGFAYASVKPRLGELIQKSIWDLLEEIEKDGTLDTDEPPPF